MVAYNMVLTGFMGSGKTTVAKYLSEKYGLKIIEMDAEIIQSEGMSIPDIFAQYGEEYFRNLETELLKKLQLEQHVVISCGGGTVLREKNVSEMKKIGIIIFLETSAQTVLERVKDDNQRPLLAGRKQIEGVAELMQERKAKYEAAADIIVSTDNRTVESIAEEIVRRIKEMEAR